VSAARTQLSLLETYEKDKANKNETKYAYFFAPIHTFSVAQLKALGANILDQKYETKYSSYVFENPSEIADRESAVDVKWSLLSELSAEKRNVLDDHLARSLELVFD
jgi:hypothetical protein